MKIRRVRLWPFGKFSDHEISFGDGLTVVLGPNEAGKSTLLAAIRAGLFVPSKLTKPNFRTYVERYLPVAGGDVVRVDLAVEAAGGEFVISRRWGAKPADELRTPDGALVADEKAIAERIRSLLPANPKTVTTVLFLPQAELSATVDKLAGEEAVSVDLGTILRRTVLETGGVSIERFRSLAAQQAKELFRHWDEEHGRPEANREWKREVGTILAAWQALEQARTALAKVKSHEQSLDDLNRRIEDIASPLGRHAAFVREQEPAWRDARERRRLEEELRAVRAERALLAKDNADWPVCEDRLRTLEAEIARGEAARTPLARERAEAAAQEQSRTLREQGARVERRKRELAAAEQQLAARPAMDRTRLEAIREAAREVERAGAAAVAGAAVEIEALTRVALQVLQGRGAPVSLDLREGERKTLAAGAPLRIQHEAFAVTVTPGGDCTAQAALLDDARATLAALLSQAGCASAAEAEEHVRQQERAAHDVERSRAELSAELSGEELPRFEARLAALGPSKETRPAAELARDLARVEASLDALRRESAERQARLAELAARHKSAELLMVSVAEKVQRERELVSALAACVPLPDGFADAKSFVDRYERSRAEAERLKDQQVELLTARARLEADAPERSVAEAGEDVAECERRFASARARGAALRRVEQEAERVLGPGDEELFSGIASEIGRLLEAMTLGRYRAVEMDRALPVSVSGGAGPMRRALLSVGTQDLLGLAVRMAMAACIIGEAGGFLLMDDPLVDLDPARQQAAARVIGSFAANRQVVLFTCHPSHAELLGGTTVRLG